MSDEHRPLLRPSEAATITSEPEATLVITTKNRKDELRDAVASALRQAGVRLEILVIDDGSTDGTSEMLQSEFPTIRVERRETSAGLIVRRNEGARLASAPIVFSIDDDAAFPSHHTIRQTLLEFDSPQVGAVAIPFVNVRQDQRVRQRAPDGTSIQSIFAYIGTAHAIRRQLFLSLGGYRELFFHQGEESDFCIRLLDNGYYVRVGSADPIHHFESPKRDSRRVVVYGRRNDILFTMFNVPFVALPIHLAATSFNGLCAGLRGKHVLWAIEGLAQGYVTAVCHLWDRRPVSWRTYRDFRRLKRREMAPVSTLSRFRNDCGSR